MFNLIGVYECKIDAKGRLPFPAAFRKQLSDVLNDGFTMKRSVFHRFIELYPMGYKIIKEPALSAWASASSNRNFITLTDKRITKGIVPDVTGMGIKDALYLLENLGLKVKIKGRGMVKNQSVVAGSRIEKGNVITLDLGT